MKLLGIPLMIVASCGGSVGTPAGTDAAADTHGDETQDVYVDAMPIDADDCTGTVASLLPAFTDDGCLTTIRVAESTHAITGWNVQGGPARDAPLTEAEARAAFAPFATASDIPPYAPTANAYEMKRDGTKRDAFVFYVLAGDWGGLAAVSALRGDVALFGTVVWGGSGRVRMPTTWRTGSETTTTCMRALDPLPLDPVPTALVTLDAPHIAAVNAVLVRSAIVRALVTAQTPTAGVLTIYPVDVGLVSPSGATTRTEYVVLIESARTVE